MLKDEVARSSARRFSDKLRRLGAAVVALTVAFTAATVLTPTAASAAPNQVQIDDVIFINEEGVEVNGFPNGSKQYLEVNMSILGQATAPVSGTIYLDDKLKGVDDRIIIKSPEGEDIGLCLVYSDRVECSLEDWYVEEHPEDMSGSFRFWVWIEAGNTSDEDLEFTVGNTTTNTVTVAPKPGLEQCETDCEFDGTDGFKYGELLIHEGAVEWWVRVPAGADGMEIGVPVRVEDYMDPALYEVLPGYPRVTYFDRVIQNAEGIEQLLYPAELPQDEYEVLDNGQVVTFITAPGLGSDAVLPEGERGLNGRVYDVTWKVKLKDGGASESYSNEVKITVGGSDGENTVVKEETVYAQGGSGEAVGRNQGRISLEKIVTGEAAGREDLPTVYTVNYTACDTTLPGYDPDAHAGPGCTEGSSNLRPGSKTYLPGFKAGTRVVVTEVTPTEPAGVSWDGQFQFVDDEGTPVPGSGASEYLDVTFSDDNDNLGKLSYYQVTNTATEIASLQAPFRAQKVITNEDGVDLSGIDGYTLGYSYPAGDGFEADSGTLVLPPNGDVATSSELPIGAELTFSEVPPPVPNATWQPAQITPASLVISDDPDQVVITVTNQIDADPGRFVARKVIDTNDDIDPAELPDVELKYWYLLNGERIEGSLTLTPGGASVMSPDIPVGSEIHFEEGDVPDVPGATWGTPTITPDTLTINGDPSQDVLVTVSNPIELDDGYFTARKTVNDVDGTGFDPSTLPDFEISYTWTTTSDSGSGSIVIAHGESGISDPVPLGAVVTVTEVAPTAPPGYQWGTPSIDPSSFVMEGDVDVQVNITNPLRRSEGVFSARKLIDPDDDRLAEVIGYPDFSLHYEYPAGTYEWGGTFDAGNGSLTLTPDGATATSSPLPLGAVLTFAEDAPAEVPGGSWGTPSFNPETLTITPDTGAGLDVTVTNPFIVDYGDFTARKTIDNPENVPLPDDQEFFLLYQWSAVGDIPAGSAFMTVTGDGEVARSGSIPYGAEVTVTEIPPLDPPGSQWGDDPTIEAGGQVLDRFVMTPGESNQVELTVTNTLARDLTRFWAHKVVENDDNIDLSGVPEYRIDYDYTFPWVDDSAPEDEKGGSASMILPANGRTVQSISLPHGTEVSVTEVAPVDIEGATWATPELSVSAFTLDADAETNINLTVTNSIVRDPVKFAANKVVVNEENVDLSGVTGYELEYTYSFPWVADDAPAREKGGSGTLMLPADGTTAYSRDFPHGTEVTVDEVNIQGVPGTTWAEPQISISEFTLDATAEILVNVEVTNTITRDLAVFNARKTIVNDDKVDLSGITGYELQYTYSFPWIADDAPADTKGGTGSLMLPADGKLSENSIELPHGTVITVNEVQPQAPQGSTWSEPIYSHKTFTLDADSSTVSLEIINEITTGRPSPRPLSATGSDFPWMGAALTSLLLIAGGVLLMRRRAS